VLATVLLQVTEVPEVMTVLEEEDGPRMCLGGILRKCVEPVRRFGLDTTRTFLRFVLDITNCTGKSL
jgi:hypothetical protein